jgi:TDG/mug DNA glycosylase family protein
VNSRPTRADLEAARERLVPDVIAPSLRVLFVGINPGLYSAAIGHHFGRPGNRFWPALHLGGFTPHLFDPGDERELLSLGLGITNIVARASARADELSPEELRAGCLVLRDKILTFAPRFAAILGVTAYRTAFDAPKAALGEQEPIGATRVWVLPNPSGLNAHFQKADLGRLFGELREIVEADPCS